ncbi:protoporphyrinogen oxidase HemJ [Rickettsia canadensis]|uniref:Protoporphyrinogen IX oxidase n=1 Tax=Rickettsia canadensis str. CA410 TaxID=1105107 RepID=A0ABN4AC71_RICCA|nr:protoporphyrinogen oxidase HemJ [Rickettsia canadensis]AFB21597.1 coproporphyrinogen III oxidase [Rickettsia canadensis str. CA410]
MTSYYLWFKSIHLISAICWMVGLLYLPRIYVYHTKAEIGSELDSTLQVMELKLLRFIMNPAMISTFIFGLINAYIYGFVALGNWFHIKMLAVLILVIFHGLLARWRKDFANGKNIHSENFYGIVNEIPTICMIIAVIMVIVKPFD